MGEVKKIIVTGSEGYLGSAIVQALLARHPEHDILPLDSLNSPIEDIRTFDRSTIDRKWEPDVIFNFAGLSGVAACADHESEAFEINADGPARLAIMFPGARFVQASTATLYSPIPSVYRDSKQQAEANLIDCASDREGPIYLCRFGTVFGSTWTKKIRWDLPLHKMVKDAVETGIVTVSSGLSTRPWLSIRRLVDVVLSLGLGDGSILEPLTLDFAEYNLTFDEIAARILTVVPNSNLITLTPAGPSGYKIEKLLDTSSSDAGRSMEDDIRDVAALLTPKADG